MKTNLRYVSLIPVFFAMVSQLWALPDIIVSQVDGPASVIAGETATYDVTIDNQGTNPNGDVPPGDNIRVRVVVSSGLGNQYVDFSGGLSLGNSQIITINVPIPGNAASGTYQVTASVEPDFAEDDDTNNSTPSQDLEVFGGPDIVATNLVFPTGAYGEGQTVPFTVSLTNTGDLDIASNDAFNIELAIVGVTTVNQGYNGGINVGDTVDIDIDVQIPQGTASAFYDTRVHADNNNTINEVSETNNVFFGDQLQVSRPDLIVSQILLTGNDPLAPGDDVGVQVTIRNNGAVDVPAGTPFTVSVNDTYVTQSLTYSNGLPVGATADLDFEFSVPLSAGDGTYEVTAVVDSDLEITELNEGNNSRTQDDLGIERPDLTIVSITKPTTSPLLPASDGNATAAFTVTVTNEGGDISSSGFFYTTMRIGDGDTVEVMHTGGLAQGATANIDFDVPIPLSDGPQDVIAQVDSRRNITEGNEGNNVLTLFDFVTIRYSPPSITIIAPDEIPLGFGAIEISALASDSDGSVVSVDFFAGGQFLATDTQAPFRIFYTPTTNGNIELTATATDEDGFTASDTKISVISPPIGLPPDASILHPLGEADINDIPTASEEEVEFYADILFYETTDASEFLVVAGVGDPDGTIEKVEFLIDGTKMGEDEEFPFTYLVLPTSTGAHNAQIIATDNDGNRRASSPVYYWVYEGRSEAPENIILTVPEEVNLGEATQLTSSAFDPDGSIRSVEYFANNVSIGTSTFPPYQVNWTPEFAGFFTMYAVVTDDTGNSAYSEPVVITVEQKDPEEVEPPSVEMFSPIDDRYYIPGTRLRLWASVSSGDALITSVEFYVNNVVVGTISDAAAETGPYYVEYTLPSIGDYRIYARVTDAFGNQDISSTVTVHAGPLQAGTPRVVIDHPLPLGAGDTVNDVSVGSDMYFNASAFDLDGTVEEVIFYINGVEVGRTSESVGDTFALYYFPNSVGDYELLAEAVDNDGNVGQSLPIVLNVVPLEAPLPKIKLAEPEPTVEVGGSLDLLANTFAGLLAIDRVDFYANGVFIGSVLSEGATGANEEVPFAFTWKPEYPGDYLIDARVVQIDAGSGTADNWILSDPRPVTVVPSGSGQEENPPEVTIFSPLDDRHYVPGTSLRLWASAKSGDALITQLDFFVNNFNVGTIDEAAAASGPYYIDYTLPSQGEYNIYVKVTDADGLQAISETITITAGPLQPGTPRVVIDHPLPLGAGDTVNDVSVGSDMYFNAMATDPDGSIEEVIFYINGQEVGRTSERVGNRFAMYYFPNASGNYELLAEAVDNEGNKGQSQPIILNVGPLEAPLPTINFIQPASVGQVNDSIFLQTTTYAGLLDIDRVDFYANGVFIGSTLPPDGTEQGQGNVIPFNFSWTPTVPGTYTLDARVVQIDAGSGTNDNWVLSNQVQVEILPAIGSKVPLVNLLYPKSGDSFTSTSIVPLLAAARDQDGSLEQVQFFVNGQPIGDPVLREHSYRPEYFPYRTSWTPGEPGVYVITAEALDNSGNRIVSSPVTVTSTTGTGAIPTVGFVNPQPSEEPVQYRSIAEGQGAVLDLELQSDNIGVAGPEAVTIIDPGYGYTTPPTLIVHGDAACPVFLQAEIDEFTGEIVDVINHGGGECMTFGYIDVFGGFGYEERLDFEVNATDADGVVDQVMFIINGSYFDPHDFCEDPADPCWSLEPYPLGPDTPYWIDRVPPFSSDWLMEDAGRYEIVAVAKDDSGNHSYAVYEIEVLPRLGSAPNAEIITPFVEENIPSNKDYEFEFIVSDTDGSITRVELYANNVLLGNPEPTGIGFNYTMRRSFADLGVGEYDLVLKAYDDDNNVTSSDAVRINVISPSGEFPTATFLRPLANSTVSAGSDVLLEVQASDPDGYIEQVEFYANGVPLQDSVDFSEPFTYFWSPGSTGLYRISARVTDNSGNITSLSQNIAVTQRIGEQPSITIQLSGSGDVTPGSSIVVGALVSDDDPEGIEVVFFLNGEQVDADPDVNGINADTMPPYFVTMQPVPSNADSSSVYTYSVTAVATDKDGNSTAVTQNSLYIARETVNLPFVQILSPGADEQLTEGSRVLIRGEARGAGSSSVTGMVFYANGIEIGFDPDPPYSLDWLPDQIGEVSIIVATYQPQVAALTRADGTTIFATPVQISRPVNVNVSPLSGSSPAISIKAYPEDDVVLGSKLLLYANAQDPKDSITEVRFFANGINITPTNNAGQQVITEPPFYMTWVPETDGEYFLYGTARDTEGNVVTSAVEGVTVQREVVPFRDITLKQPVTDREDGNYLAGTSIVLRSTLSGFATPPEKVIFYANGEVIGEAEEQPYNFSWVPQLTGKAVLFCTAAADTPGESRVTAVSNVVTINLLDFIESQPPEVSIISPAEDTLYSINQQIAVEVDATDANGFVTKVELLVNDVTVDVLTSAPYVFIYDPINYGTLRLSAIATDNTGASTVSETVNVEVINGPIPVVTDWNVFGTDSYDIIVGQTLRFVFAATDESGIRSFELFANGQSLGIDTVPPYEFIWTPSTAGSYMIAAEIINLRGVTQVFALPNPFDVFVASPQTNISDFIEQTYLDLYNRVLDYEAQQDYEKRFAENVLNREGMILEILQDDVEYSQIRGIFMIHYLMTGQWPNRDEFEEDYSIAATTQSGTTEGTDGLSGVTVEIEFEQANLITALLPRFEEIFWTNGRPFPNTFSPRDDMVEFFKILFRTKYGVEPNRDQIDWSVDLLQFEGVVSFIEKFAFDNGVIGTEGFYITPQLGIPNPPNDRLATYADAASLMVNLWRQPVTMEEVETLAQRQIYTQIQTVLNDGRYSNRFDAALLTAVDMGNGVRWSEWFGYYDAKTYPWIYHFEHGWNFVDGQSDGNVWLWSSQMDWMWTAQGIYPFIYHYAGNTWMWYYEGGTPDKRYFYNYANSQVQQF